MSIATATIVGHVGRDPEVSTAGSTTVAKFSIAVKRKRKGEEITDWHDVVAFGRQADFVAQHITKGRLVAVVGRLEVETWADKTTGAKRSKHVIAADSVTGLGPKGGGEGRPAPAPYDAGDEPLPANGGDDDIPF